MRAHGIPPETIEAIVQRVSRDRYSGNVRTYNVRPDGRKREPGTLFTLRPGDSHGPGSRFADSPEHDRDRAVWACSWDAHGYVMAEIFRRFPDAIVSTGLATYRGRDDFNAQTAHNYAAASHDGDPDAVPGTVNLGAASGDVGPGDYVIVNGDVGYVLRVYTLPAGHTRAPIRSDHIAVIVVTDVGERALGATSAEIGPDLRMHWSREIGATAGPSRALALS